MSLQKKQEEESICNCSGLEEFFGMPDCQHVITTNPNLLEKDFPTLFDLCKKGGKYRIQTRRITHVEISNSIKQFCRRLEKKYGPGGNELSSWSYAFQVHLAPFLKNLSTDYIIPFREELTRLQQLFIITQVDKDSSGIAFVCKNIAHKLTKRFIYGPYPNTPGLFQMDTRPMASIVTLLRQYSLERGIRLTSESLPQFKLIMKMHKSS